MALTENEIRKQYRASLCPFAAGVLEPLGLPPEVSDFLAQTGLPVRSRYELTPNVPVTFLAQPGRKRYYHFRGAYLHIAYLDTMGELAVGLDTKRHEVTRFPGENIAPVHVNSGLAQFVECFGVWQALYPQYQDAVRQAMHDDPDFCIFDHREITKPYLGRLEARLRGIDPDALQWRKFFWRRMCEPDVY